MQPATVMLLNGTMNSRQDEHSKVLLAIMALGALAAPDVHPVLRPEEVDMEYQEVVRRRRMIPKLSERSGSRRRAGADCVRDPAWPEWWLRARH